MRSVKIFLFLSLSSMTSASYVSSDESWEMDIKNWTKTSPEFGLHSRLGESSDENTGLDAFAHWTVKLAKKLLRNADKNDKAEDERMSQKLRDLVSFLDIPKEDLNSKIVTTGFKNEYIGKPKMLNTIKESYPDVTTNKISEGVKTDDDELSTMLKNMAAKPKLIGGDTAPSKGPDDDELVTRLQMDLITAKAPKLDSQEDQRTGSSW